jgi:hypothetical protein
VRYYALEPVALPGGSQARGCCVIVPPIKPTGSPTHSSSMSAASMPYDLVRVVPESLKRLLRPSAALLGLRA